MQDTTTKAPALSRTWRTHNTDKMDGVVIRAHSHTVTLTRAAVGGPLAAEVDGEEVDGEEVDVTRALYLLEDAHRVEVLAEVLATDPTPPTIGKARACKLHRIMGRLGIHDHYATACFAVRRDVGSLAALTESEAREVWAYLCAHFARARQVAA